MWCFNFFYGKMNEREVFNCNKLAPCGPALSVCVSVHLRYGGGRGRRVCAELHQCRASAVVLVAMCQPLLSCTAWYPVCWLAGWGI